MLFDLLVLLPLLFFASPFPFPFPFPVLRLLLPWILLHDGFCVIGRSGAEVAVGDGALVDRTGEGALVDRTCEGAFVELEVGGDGLG